MQVLYEKMNGMAVQSKGLSLVPKLKLEYTSYSRMHVDLATHKAGGNAKVAKVLAFASFD